MSGKEKSQLYKAKHKKDGINVMLMYTEWTEFKRHFLCKKEQ